MNKVSISIVLSTGLALFSMFFGSGNLLFPLRLGKIALNYPIAAGIGLVSTGVILPFIGAYVVLANKGSYRRFFRPLGRVGMLYLPFFLLLLMGPLGVIPRCITVSFGSFQFISQSLSLPVFSFCMCLAIFLITLNQKYIVPFLGTLLTPLLLISMGILAVKGIFYFHEPAPDPIFNFSDLMNSYWMGIQDGYQTLDLLASFFFSSFIINHITHKIKENPKINKGKKQIALLTMASFLIAGALLAAIYIVLILLGTIHASHMPIGQDEMYLGLVAQEVLGANANSVVCVIVILACLSTAIALVTMFSEFLCKHIFANKIHLHVGSIITLAISFVLSLTGLKGVSALLTPILQWLYPPIIIYTLYKFYLVFRKN